MQAGGLTQVKEMSKSQLRTLVQRRVSSAGQQAKCTTIWGRTKTNPPYVVIQKIGDTATYGVLRHIHYKCIEFMGD